MYFSVIAREWLLTSWKFPDMKNLSGLKTSSDFMERRFVKYYSRRPFPVNKIYWNLLRELHRKCDKMDIVPPYKLIRTGMLHVGLIYNQYKRFQL